MIKPIFLLLVLLAGVALANTVRAGVDVSKSSVVPVAPADTTFQKGTFELQVTAGALFSAQRTTYLRPNLDYDLGVVRVGYMLDGVSGHGIFRGNDEVMLEAAGGSIWVGPGSGLGGLSLIYRRNFLYPRVQARLVPYVDLGAGGVYSDGYHTFPQRELGSAFEFDLQAGLGLRFRLSRDWSIDAEANFRHISNADFATRNYGTNDIGGLIGVSRSF